MLTEIGSSVPISEQHFLHQPASVSPALMVYFEQFHLDQEINPVKGYPRQAIFQPNLSPVQLTGHLAQRSRGYWRLEMGRQPGTGMHYPLKNTLLGNWGCFVRAWCHCLGFFCWKWSVLKKKKSILKSGLCVPDMSVNEPLTKELGFSSLCLLFHHSRLLVCSRQ